LGRGNRIKSVKVRFFLTSPSLPSMAGSVVKSVNRAFTLIELLIVVAIISILAAIAVPNFAEAQVRAKVARVIADMRTMETGIMQYKLDNNKFIVRNGDWQSSPPKPDYIPEATTKILDPTSPEARVGLKMVTTPISYLSSIPVDVFNTPIREKYASYPGTSDALDYWDDDQLLATRKVLNPIKGKLLGKEGFALLSVGPDKHIGLNNSAANPDYPAEDFKLRTTMRWIYEPTNGTYSTGNVYRFSNGMQQNSFFPMN